jgi:hypothetical protein
LPGTSGPPKTHRGGSGESETYWRTAIEQHVAIGERRSDVEAWFRTQRERLDGPPRYYQHPSPRYDRAPPERVLIASQTIDAEGVKFPCKFWTVLIDINLDENDRVASRKVSKAGMCL